MAERTHKLGRFTLIRPLGLGGMAEVYLARVEGLEDFRQYYAVKRILPKLVKDAKFVRMFLDEARVTVALRHPNIVQVHDLSEDRGNYYIAMEYVDGMDLRRLMSLCSDLETTIPYRHVLRVIGEALRALDHAHTAVDAEGGALNLVHRDVSPANVLLSRTGAVKLTDFGVSKAAIARWETESGEILGKYRYFAPELIRGDPPSARSDLFALGAVLFELVTGEPLLLGAQYRDVVKELRRFDPEQQLERDPSMPTALEPILSRALATEPGDRYPTAAEFLADLQDHIFEDGIRVSGRALAEFLTQVENASAPSGAPLGEDSREPPSISIVPIDEQETDQERAAAGIEPEQSQTEQLGWRFPTGGRATVFVPGRGTLSMDTRALRAGLTDGGVGPEALVQFDADRWRPIYEYRRGQPTQDRDGQLSRLRMTPVDLRAQLSHAIRGLPSCVATCWCADEVIALHLRDGWLVGAEGSLAPRTVVEFLLAEGALSQTQGMVVKHLCEGDDEQAVRVLAERKLVPAARLENVGQRRRADHLARCLSWPDSTVMVAPITAPLENAPPCPLDDAIAITIRDHMGGGALARALAAHRGRPVSQGLTRPSEAPVPIRSNELTVHETAARGGSLDELLGVATPGSELDAIQAAFLLLQFDLLTLGS